MQGQKIKLHFHTIIWILSESGKEALGGNLNHLETKLLSYPLLFWAVCLLQIMSPWAPRSWQWIQGGPRTVGFFQTSDAGDSCASGDGTSWGTQCLPSLCQPSVPRWHFLSSRGRLIMLPSIFPSCCAMKRPRDTVSRPAAAGYRGWVTGKSLTMVSEFLTNHIISPKRGECEQNRKKHVGGAWSTKTKVNQIQVWSINGKLPLSAFTSSLDLLPIKPASNSIALGPGLFSGGCCTPYLWDAEYACWFHLVSDMCLYSFRIAALFLICTLFRITALVSQGSSHWKLGTSGSHYSSTDFVALPMLLIKLSFHYGRTFRIV